MPFKSTLNNPRSLARKAGVLYLLIAVFGAFAIAYVPSQIVVFGNPGATLHQLQAQANLFRAGIAADFIVISAEIALTAMLYFLLHPVSRVAAMVAAMARLGMIFVMAINMLLNATAFLMAQGALSGSAETILTLLEVHAQGVFLWGALFGIHLFVLGALVCRSGYFPKLLGGALFIGSFGYMLEGLSRLMGLDHAALTWLTIALLTIVTLAELAFAFWLLIKGPDEPKWRAAQL